MSKLILVTGESGTLGSEIALRFGLNGSKAGFIVHLSGKEKITGQTFGINSRVVL